METNELLERLSAALEAFKEAAAALIQGLVEMFQAAVEYLQWVMGVIQAEADANGMTAEEYIHNIQWNDWEEGYD